MFGFLETKKKRDEKKETILTDQQLKDIQEAKTLWSNHLADLEASLKG